MLVENQMVEVRWRSIEKEKLHWYEEKGYKLVGDTINIKVEDLLHSSGKFIKVFCDCEECENHNNPLTIRYCAYIKNIERNNGKYYCKSCRCTRNIKKTEESRILNFMNNVKNLCDSRGYQFVGNYEDFVGKRLEKFQYICPKHGLQIGYLSNFKNGSGCNECGNETIGEKRSLTQNEVKDIIESKNNNIWMNPSEYIGINSKNLIVKCGKCNNDKFNQQVEQDITQKPNTDNRPVAELKLSPTSVSLEEGKSTSVKATIRPNDAKNKTLSWTSSDDGIATVSNGTIRANKPGSCKITATTTDGSGISASVSVNVTKKPEPPKPKPPTTSKPTTSGGNGKPEIGDAVTFVSGRYYNDSQGKRPSGNQMLGKTVYINRINTKKWATKPYHVAKDKQGKHALGWLGLNQIKGYKFGTRHVNKTGEYWTGEGEGNNFTGSPEIIISKDGGVLTHLERGDKVFNHEMSENLWNLAKEGDSLLMNDKALGLNMNGGTKLVNNNINYNNDVNINNHFEVHGDMDSRVADKLSKQLEKTILENGCKFTVNHISTELRKVGLRR